MRHPAKHGNLSPFLGEAGHLVAPLVVVQVNPFVVGLHVIVVHVVVHRHVWQVGHVEVSEAFGEERVERDLRIRLDDLPPCVIEILHVVLGDGTPLVADLLGLDTRRFHRVGVLLEVRFGHLVEVEDGSEFLGRVLGNALRIVFRHAGDLLQLDAKQFFQIMMLPQGEFRNFLIASSNEKERVLRNLFGTEMYQQFNEWLKEQVKAQSKKLEHQQLVASQIMERFEWEEAQEVLTVAEGLTLWAQDLEKQQAQLQQLLHKKDQAIQEMKAAQDAFYRAKEIENARIEWQGLQEKARELHAKKTEIAQKKAQLNQLVWALEHQEIMQQKEERVKEAQQAAQQINETKQQLQEIQQQQVSWQDQRALIDGIKKKQEAASQKVQRIQQQIPLAQRTQAQQEEVAQLEKAAQQQTTELTKINQAQASAKAQAQHLVEEIETLRGFQTEAVKLVETQALVEKWQQAKAQFREAEQKAGEQQQIHSELVLEQQQLAASLLELQKTLKQETSQNARMQIARLRLLLEENEPCPVCGSLDHPNTQEHTTYRIEDIIASEQRLEQTQEKLTKIQQQVSANQTLQEQRMASHQCCCAEASGIRLDCSSTGICYLAAVRTPRGDYRGNDGSGTKETAIFQSTKSRFL